jgi:hypothetical protein
MDGLTEGRIVHYVLPDGPNAGEHRAAMIARIWERSSGYVNLWVFQDGTNDGLGFSAAPTWTTSVPYSEDTHVYRTWHWIERASGGE